MAQRRNDRDNKKGGSAKDRRPIKKKTSILTTESIDWIDYKDVNLLRRFMSERAKIRARRVTGNDQKQQAAVSRAIKLAREMALLPYARRVASQRTRPPRDGRPGRGDGELPAEPMAADAPIDDELAIDDAEGFTDDVAGDGDGDEEE